MDSFVFDVQGAGTAKVELFKNRVVQLRKTLQFSEWAEAEEWAGYNSYATQLLLSSSE